MEKVSSLKVSLVSILKAMANCNLEQDVKDLCALALVLTDSNKSVFEPVETDSCKKDCFERVLELCLDLLLMQVLRTLDSSSCCSNYNERVQQLEACEVSQK